MCVLVGLTGVRAGWIDRCACFLDGQVCMLDGPPRVHAGWTAKVCILVGLIGTN